MGSTARSVENSVCLNHPDRPATTRCGVCHKPICDDCTVEASAQVFCSGECATKFQNTREGVEAFESRLLRDRRRKRIRRFITLVVLVAASYGAYRYFTQNPDKLDELKRKTNRVMEEGKDKLNDVRK